MKGKILIIIIAFSVTLFGQFNSGISDFTTSDLGTEINNNNDMASFLNISRLKMEHSFSMSMGGSSFGSQSFVSYHNKFMLPFSEKLTLSGDVILRQQAFASNPMMKTLGNQTSGIYFDTNLEYKINENSKVSFGISNIPRYNYYNPYYYGGNSLWQNEIR